MKKIPLKTILYRTFIAVFVLCAIILLVGNKLSTHDNKDYRELQKEFRGPDTIDAVLHDGELGRIYVCYTNALYVNVYTEQGQFLWAVSVPYMRYGIFELSDDVLSIYSAEDEIVYKYSAKDGEFLGTEEISENYDFYDSIDEHIGVANKEEFYYDDYCVYRVLPDKSREAIVSRSEIYGIFNGIGTISIGFFASLAAGIIAFMDKRKDYIRAKKRIKETGVGISDKKLKFLLGYYKATAIVHIVYSIVNIIAVALDFDHLISVIFYLCAHFVLSNIILGWTVERNCDINKEEQSILNYWTVLEFDSFIFAVLSMIVVIGIM